MKSKMLMIKLMLGLLYAAIMALPLKLLAQQTVNKNTVEVELVVLDTALLNLGEIEFKMYADGINTSFSSKTVSYIHKIELTKTKLTIPISTNSCYGRIDFKYRNQRTVGIKAPLNVGNNLFIFQNGDRIQMVLGKNSIAFSGLGSEKYTCALEIANINTIARPQSQEENRLFANGQYQQYFERSKTDQDSLLSLQKQQLNRYKGKIDREMWQLLDADCWAEYNRAVLAKMLVGTSRLGNTFGQTHRDAVKQKYERYLKSFNEQYLPDSVLAKSYKYCDFLFWKEYGAEQLYHPSLLKSTSPFLLRFEAIAKNYKGIIRDKLSLVNFYFGKVNEEDLNKIADLALATTKNEVINNAMLALIDSKRGPAYPFKLLDQYGAIHKMSDYLGKLVIIDFWYTGCINCIELAEKLKPVIKEYKATKDVVFLSVSIDGDKNRDAWLKSLKDETYSSKEETNLLAQGKTDGIVKHYSIFSYPTLIVISKKGQVITTRPPDPRNDMEGFKKMIKTNL